jgi:membrane protein YqaA with SNARE-associated domain
VAEWFTAWGAWGLAAISFLAGSVFPLPSEAVLIALVAMGKSKWAMTAVATVFNVLGAATLVSAGRSSRELVENQRPDLVARAHRAFERYGPWMLLLSWVPMIGDVFVLVAGALRVRWAVAVPLLAAGKAARYAFVAMTAAAALR